MQRETAYAETDQFFDMIGITEKSYQQTFLLERDLAVSLDLDKPQVDDRIEPFLLLDAIGIGNQYFVPVNGPTMCSALPIRHWECLQILPNVALETKAPPAAATRLLAQQSGSESIDFYDYYTNYSIKSYHLGNGFFGKIC